MCAYVFVSMCVRVWVCVFVLCVYLDDLFVPAVCRCACVHVCIRARVFVGDSVLWMNVYVCVCAYMCGCGYVCVNIWCHEQFVAYEILCVAVYCSLLQHFGALCCSVMQTACTTDSFLYFHRCRCICICTCVCMFTGMRIRMCMYMCMRTRTYKCMCIYMQVWMCKSTKICKEILVYMKKIQGRIDTGGYNYMYLHVSMHRYIYIFSLFWYIHMFSFFVVFQPPSVAGFWVDSTPLYI